MCPDRPQTSENEKKNVKNEVKKRKPKSAFSCETCEFYDEDEYEGAACLLSLDEDEFADFAARSTGSCPYYRFYDEYKLVQKQN